MKYKIDSNDAKKFKKASINNEKSFFDEKFPLPKYSSQIYNIISSTGKATVPAVVGQMSEIVPKFINDFYDKNNTFPDYKDWTKYYLENHKNEYEKGLKKLREYIEIYKEGIESVFSNDEQAKIWFNKFIFYQNFEGFQYEKIIFKFLVKTFNLSKSKKIFRKSNNEEESKNIDFVLENSQTQKQLFFNCKPFSYKRKNTLPTVNDKIIIIFYEVKDNEISIDISDQNVELIRNFS